MPLPTLTTLEIRRIRGDLIEVYKILNGLEKINPDSMFTRFTYNNTRCHTMKLEKKHVLLDSRKYFFTQRVIDYWNALPQTAIDAESINHFKDQLNVHLYNIIRGQVLLPQKFHIISFFTPCIQITNFHTILSAYTIENPLNVPFIACYQAYIICIHKTSLTFLHSPGYVLGILLPLNTSFKFFNYNFVRHIVFMCESTL